MAEARAAVTDIVISKELPLQRVDPLKHNLQIATTNDGLTLFVPHPRYIVAGVGRRVSRAMNWLVTSMWPAPPALVTSAVVGFTYHVVNAPADSWFRSGPVADLLWRFDSLMPFTQSIPVKWRVAYLAANSSILFLGVTSFIQRIYLRMLLHYRGWIFQTGPPSLFLKGWFILLKMYIGHTNPLLYSFQGALPRMPVPDLHDTLQKYITSVQPLFGEEKMRALNKAREEFENGEGRNLQRTLVALSWIKDNYVSDWWESFVYLRGRDSILINSNYYGIGYSHYLPTKVQVSRAAAILYHMLETKMKIDNEEVRPMALRGTVPMCMAQYERAFSTTRVPGREQDILENFDSIESAHVVVLYKGVYYRLDPFNDHGALLSPYTLQEMLKKIVADREKNSEEPSCQKVTAFTTLPRTRWAEIRETHFKDGVNRYSLDVIESAIMILHLDEHEPTSLTERGRLLMHGEDGTVRWVDKSITAVVFANGRFGINAEHSWGDAPVIAHILEYVLSGELAANHYNAEGTISPSKDFDRKDVHSPSRLKWSMTEDLLPELNHAVEEAGKAVADLDLVVEKFGDFGKGKMKKCRVGPDSFIQMALQLAYYRIHQKVVMTYESAMTRLYKNGRTETIRSLSNESKLFVESFDREEVPLEQKRNLMYTACMVQQNYSREAMIGQGCDRHMFALYVISRAQSSFLKECLSIPFTLSTSQLPQRQSPERWPSDDEFTDKYHSPSGGFGPVHDQGYGVSYMVAGENSIYFHVSSKFSCPQTSSRKFMDNIFKALHDMIDLYKDAKSS